MSLDPTQVRPIQTTNPITVFGCPNIANINGLNRYTIVAGSVAAGLTTPYISGAYNLADEDINLIWRSQGLTAWATWIDAGLSAAPSTGGNADGVVLLNHNWRRVNGTTQQVRIRADGAGFLNCRMRGASVLASTNYTTPSGANCGQDPDLLAPTFNASTSHAANTSIRVGFDTKINNGVWLENARGLKPTGVCTVRVSLRATGSGNPTYAIKLYDNGTLRATLATGTAAFSTATLVTCTFTGNQILTLIGGAGTNPSAAAVQIQIDGTTVGGNTIEVAGVEVIVEPQVDFDSGVITPSLPLAWSNMSTAERANQTLNWPVLFGATIPMIGLWIDIFDLGNADGFTQIGAMVMGPKLTPAVGVRYGCKFGFTDPSVVDSSLGSNVAVDQRISKRTSDVTLQNMTVQDGIAGFYEALFRAKGIAKPFFFWPWPDDANLLHSTAFFARLTQQQNDVSLPNAAGWGVELQLEEWR